MQMDLIRERVEEGAKFLDKKVPDWATMLDLGALELGDCSQCVLGQLYGHYDNGVVALDITCEEYTTEPEQESWRLGFEVGPYPGYQGSARDEENQQAEYDALRDEWIVAVKKRLDDGIRID